MIPDGNLNMGLINNEYEDYNWDQPAEDNNIHHDPTGNDWMTEESFSVSGTPASRPGH